MWNGRRRRSWKGIQAFLFTVEAEEGRPLARDTSLRHVTLNGERALNLQIACPMTVRDFQATLCHSQ